MVFQATEFTGTLNCKGCVIVPCQCYSKDQSYFTAVQDSNNNPPQNDNYINNNYEPINKHVNFFDTNSTKTDLLWNKQFSRWWSWNWQRKRKDLLSKFGIKHADKTYKNPEIKKHLTQDKSCECKLSPRKHEKHVMKNEKELKYSKTCSKISIGKLHQPILHSNTSNYSEPIEHVAPIPSSCLEGLKEPYKGRRKRNKHKTRIYEGWMRELRSSDSETSDTEITIKNKPRKYTNKEKMHYLSLRLNKFNSEEIFITKKSKNTRNKKEGNVTDYISPITGKLYNLNLEKTNLLINNDKETDQLNTIDKNIFTQPTPNCILNYNLIKQEHYELLKSINEVLNKPIKNNLKESRDNLTNNILITSNNVNASSPKIINTEDNTVFTIMQNEHYKYNLNDPSNISLQKPFEDINQSKFIYYVTSSCNINDDGYINQSTTNNKSLLEIKSNKNIQIKPKISHNRICKSMPGNLKCNKPINFHNFKLNQSGRSILLSNSRNTLDKNVKSNKNMTDIFSNVLSNQYDINYIQNNLEYIKSSITDTAFIQTYLENSK